MLIGLHRRPRGLGAVADTIASAIYRQEGAVQNNNPGNLLYAGQPGATGKDSRGFAIFSTLQAGQTAEVNQINLDITRGTCATGAPVVNLSDLISCLSPPNENDTATYVANVSTWTGIDPNASLQSMAIGGTNIVSLPTDLSSGVDVSDDTSTPDYTWALVGAGALALWWAFNG
jgi:hypothetical protein